MRRLSIGSRLTLWYLAIFAAAQLCFGIGMWLVLRQDLYSIADAALTAQVDDLTNFLKTQKKKNMTVDKLREEASEAYAVEHSGDFLQIYDADGNWIFRAPTLERNRLTPVAPASVQGRSFQNVQLETKPYRFITQRIIVNGRAYTVQTGVPIDQTIAALSLFRRYLLMLAPLLLLAAASGGYWLSRKALSPVDALTRTAKNIGGSNLGDRLEKLTTGDELQRLSDTLNEMLGRIESAFLRVTQFTADASHELRTPISLIRTEAEIALRKSRGNEEYREALRHILLEAERTSSLVEELLMLARADSGRENLQVTLLDLRSVIAETAHEWRQLLESRDLRFTQSDRGLRASGPGGPPGHTTIAGHPTRQCRQVHAPARSRRVAAESSERNGGHYPARFGNWNRRARSEQNLRALLSRGQGEKPCPWRGWHRPRHCQLDCATAPWFDRRSELDWRRINLFRRASFATAIGSFGSIAGKSVHGVRRQLARNASRLISQPRDCRGPSRKPAFPRPIGGIGNFS